jgi:hypothetical protein
MRYFELYFSERVLAFVGRVPVVSALVTIALALSAAGTSFAACNLDSAHDNIKHVIYVQFDNLHFTRDNPNVPSDLEQMPNLLNFMKDNGTLLSKHHTPLIAHTATDILTSLTGVYGDHHGVPVANSYGYFKPNGTVGFLSSFGYWTDRTPDGTFNMLTAGGKNAPAPWVPYTRAGCNFGAVGTANVEFENTSDVSKVFGPNSPEAQEVSSHSPQAYPDFVGIAVHCALNDALCSNANAGIPDLLPDEPGGYQNYQVLFGHKFVAPQISPSGPLTDLDGNVIKDSSGNIGFPGFDGMVATVSLGYVAAMQEHNVPVTFAYISDAHDDHVNDAAFGPGQAGYVAQLKSYNDAFGKFFERLAKDGINKSNTLFVITADEGDHFAGGPPSPAGCDGVHVPCTYSKIGELDGNLTGLLATEQGITTPFDIHFDSAPTVYITGNPARDAAVTRNFERATGKLTTPNLITGQTDDLTNYLADPVEMKLLHMITADPARTPTFTMFAKPDYFLFTGAPNCNSPCVHEEAGFAWNHGDVAPEINTTWLGMVGPGVRRVGVDDDIWSDHTDIRPTMLELLGLKDDYAHDGRALFEVLEDSALPESVEGETLVSLARAYKKINAPVGPLGLASLRISTKALESGSTADDSTYTTLENKLTQITTQRNALAGQMIALLEQAAFQHKKIDKQEADKLIDAAKGLLEIFESDDHDDE